MTVGKPKKLEDKVVRPEFMASLPKKKLNCSQRKLLLLAREFKKQGVRNSAKNVERKNIFPPEPE